MSIGSSKQSVKLPNGLNELLSDEFNAAEYVNSFLKETRPGEELRKLQSLRSQLNTSSNAASEQIKDIVFDHYKQFIDTSKEISSLEREIYELSSLLTDQKSVLEGLMEMCGQDRRSSCSVSIHSAGNVQQTPLQSLVHRVEGVADVLNHLKPTEKVLLMSEMTLLDENTMEQQQPLLLVLLTETFIIARPSSSGNRLRFQLSSSHRLDKVAIVNVKRASTEHSYAELIIQLLIFPEQLYVKCESARVKRQWLEGVESAKRALEQEKSLQRQATIRAKRRKSSSTPHPDDPRARLQKYAQSQINAVIHEGREAYETNAGIEDEPNVEDRKWLEEILEEIQEVITHRHMDEAVEMLSEWKQCGCKDVELNSKFTEVEKEVVRMLSDDIRRPHHGGARALSKPLSLLKQLNRATYATDLYLKRRSTFLSAKARELTISEDPLSYVRQVAKMFVNEILDVLNEFKTQPTEYCLVQQWSCGEMSLLLSLIRRHVIEVAPTMAVLARTWSILLVECDRLADAGIDLSFEVHRLLAPSLRTALETNFANIIESIRLRIQEEQWQPYNLESEANLNRYLEEMSDVGFTLDWCLSSQPPYSLNVSQSGCHFSRVAYSLSRDLAHLRSSSHLCELTDSFIRLLWTNYCKCLTEAPQSEVHSLTCQFMMNQVVPLCEKAYGDDQEDGILRSLIHSQFPRLARFERKPSSGSEDEEVANV
ncbi:Exocyst complex component 8 [Aphelenchoides besseyi]|nr:Exocyst complex component 8 [Aphelenchoides besseyi]